MVTIEEERRGVPRSGVLKSAKILVGGAVLNCVVLDTSTHGARIRLEAMVALPKEVTLCLRGGAGFRAEVRWARAQEAGLGFLSQAALPGRKAGDAESVLQRLNASGFDALLAQLATARHFDDPGLAQTAREADLAVKRLAEALARLSRTDSWKPPDVFDS